MQIDVCFGKQKHNSKTIQNLIQTIVRELLQVKTNIMKPRVKILCWTEEIWLIDHDGSVGSCVVVLTFVAGCYGD